MMAQRWLVATVLLVALSGCGDDADTKPATVPAPAISSEAPAPSAPAVAAGRTAAAPTATAAPRSGSQPATPPGPRSGHRAAKPRTVATGTSGFVAAVQNRLPEVAVDHRDEEIAEIAGQACTSLAAGEGAGTIVAGTERFGTDEETAHKLIKMAIDNVCPDQDRRIEEF
ncbi:DUF732 domain-containing protein [Actinoplanes sp. NPDC049118]|uniref:DUF732 domain-containing protein n=1 Tax=Actinoplanes sp. NPDC049118 TaxID=3155769 RepID=UPI0033DB434F